MKEYKLFLSFGRISGKRKLSDVRIRAYKVVIRVLKRYELYAQATQSKQFRLSFNSITALVSRDFEEFLRNEYSFAKRYPLKYNPLIKIWFPFPTKSNKSIFFACSFYKKKSLIKNALLF